MELEPGPPSEKFTCTEGGEMNKGGCYCIPKRIISLSYVSMHEQVFVCIDGNADKDIHIDN